MANPGSPMLAQRTLLLTCAIVVLGGIAWLVARRHAAPSGPPGSNAATADDGRSEGGAPLELDAPIPSHAGGTDAGPAAASDDVAEREAAAEFVSVHASHALDPDEPTLVRGRVVDRNGAAQAGCTVWIAPRTSTPPVGLKPGRSWPLDAAPIDRDGARSRLRDGVREADSDRRDEMLRVRRAATDADGRFELAGLPSGPIRLAIRSDVLAPRDLDDLALAARATLDVGDIVLDFALVLEGEVLDAEGRAISGARIDGVDALSPNAPQPGPAIVAPLAITGANGRFRTTTLAFGSFGLLASHPDHVSQRIDGACEDTKRPPPPIVFRLPAATSLSGSVFGPPPAELETLCVVATPEPAEFALEDPRQSLLSGSSPRLGASADQRSARVDREGRFQLAGLDSKRAHTLRLGPTNARGDELACAYASVRAAPGAREIDIALPRGSLVSFEARGNGTGTPVEDFDVWIGGAAPSRLLDEEGLAVRRHPGGVFRMSGVRLTAEPSELVIAALGHAVYRQDLYVDPGADVTLGTIHLDPLFTVEVLVTDETGARIQGASVESHDRDPDRYALLGRRSGATDRKGLARVTSYSSSGATLCVDAAGYAMQCLDFGDRGWTARERCEVQLSIGARVRVHVQDREGAPVAGVTVVAGGLARAVSDATGIATFEHLMPGVTEFSCSSLRARRAESATELVVGSEGEQDVWLTSPARADLAGRVLDDRVPVAGAELSLRIVDESPPKSGRRVRGPVAGTTRSDSSGAYRFDDVEAGLFVLEVAVDRAVRPIGFDLVVEPPRTNADVDLGTARVLGRVRDARGRSQPGATVWVAPVDRRLGDANADHLDTRFVDAVARMLASRDGEGRPTPCFTTDANGAFDFWLPLDRGEFVVCASDPRDGAGWTRFTRAPDAVPEVLVQLAPSGELELDVLRSSDRESSVAVLMPDAEPSAWLVKVVRSGEVAHWSGLVPGAWTVWMIGSLVDEDGERSIYADLPLHVEIEPASTTRVEYPPR